VTSRRVRVLIAEDSIAMQKALLALLGEDPALEVIGCAADGIQAVEMTQTLRPDVVTMDVSMPRLDGVEATAKIMASAPARVLVVSSVSDTHQLDLTFQAITAGAMEVLAKPIGSSPESLRAWGSRVREAIHLMAEVPVVTRRQRRAPTYGHPYDAIGIVASTGGPPALAHLFGALPASLPIPIFVAQHIAVGFIAGLVRWLASVTRLRVMVAGDGMVPRPGHVYFAPDGCDFEIDPEGRMRVPAPAGRDAPSGTRLLRSMAHTYGSRAVGIVLTGMGDDGVDGLLAIRDAGGATLAQSKDSCVVFGMPQAALVRGATSDLLSLDGLAEAIRRLAAAGTT
jgi:two-component system chemotaxis response regulator CheB